MDHPDFYDAHAALHQGPLPWTGTLANWTLDNVPRSVLACLPTSVIDKLFELAWDDNQDRDFYERPLTWTQTLANWTLDTRSVLACLGANVDALAGMIQLWDDDQDNAWADVDEDEDEVDDSDFQEELRRWRDPAVRREAFDPDGNNMITLLIFVVVITFFLTRSFHDERFTSGLTAHDTDLMSGWTALYSWVFYLYIAWSTGLLEHRYVGARFDLGKEVILAVDICVASFVSLLSWLTTEPGRPEAAVIWCMINVLAWQALIMDLLRSIWDVQFFLWWVDDFIWGVTDLVGFRLAWVWPLRRIGYDG